MLPCIRSTYAGRKEPIPLPGNRELTLKEYLKLQLRQLRRKKRDLNDAAPYVAGIIEAASKRFRTSPAKITQQAHAMMSKQFTVSVTKRNELFSLNFTAKFRAKALKVIKSRFWCMTPEDIFAFEIVFLEAMIQFRKQLNEPVPDQNNADS